MERPQVMYGGLHAKAPLPAPDALLELARAFTPRAQAFGATPVLLDLRGLGRAWPSPEALGAALLATARERALETQVAIACSRVAALVVAQAHPGLNVVPPGREAVTLAPLPLALLDLPPERAELLRRWGLRTLGDLAALPAKGLAERLGPEGPRLARLARGEDDSPLVPAPPPASRELTLDLEWPVDGLEPLAFLLSRVLEPLLGGLKQRGQRAAALELTLGLVDGSCHRLELEPAAPSAEPRTWRTLLLLDLEAHPPGDAIRSLTVRARETPLRSTQFSLLDPAQPSPEKLAELLGRLHDWTAARRACAGAASLLDTHRPGAFALGTFAPGPFTGGGPGPAKPSAAPRLALRAFRPPRSAEVAVAGGAPVFVAARGVRGAVAERSGPWRASGDWWDEAWSREEWDVALTGGGLYRICHDRLREAWFVEGELD